MKQVTAIIHLVKRGRTTSARYGQFLRPDKAPHECATDLHLWLGRELSLQEFNEQMPKAIRSVLSTDTVFAQMIEREVPGDEPAAAALDALKKEHEDALAALKTEHEQALASVQQGVNEFTAEHNEKLEWARARIASLEAALAEATKPEPVIVEAGESAEVNIPGEAAPPSCEVGKLPVVEAAPSAAGEQLADAAATPTDKPKAKAKAKAK